MNELSGVVMGIVPGARPARTERAWAASDDFEDFVAARGAALVRTARGLLRDPQHAEDVVQEVLVKVHRHWATILRQDVPDAYVRRMLVNQCTSFWRRAVRREHVVPDDVLPHVVDARSRVLDHATAVDDRDLVLALLRRLPAKQRAALVLRHYEGLPDAEIADVMGTSVQTVRSNVHRGLASLRRMLADQEVTR